MGWLRGCCCRPRVVWTSRVALIWNATFSMNWNAGTRNRRLAWPVPGACLLAVLTDTHLLVVPGHDLFPCTLYECFFEHCRWLQSAFLFIYRLRLLGDVSFTCLLSVLFRTVMCDWAGGSFGERRFKARVTKLYTFVHYYLCIVNIMTTTVCKTVYKFYPQSII
jgi:hypothetical protein